MPAVKKAMAQAMTEINVTSRWGIVLFVSFDGDKEFDEVVWVVERLNWAFVEEKIFAVVELGVGAGEPGAVDILVGCK